MLIFTLHGNLYIKSKHEKEMQTASYVHKETKVQTKLQANSLSHQSLLTFLHLYIETKKKISAAGFFVYVKMWQTYPPAELMVYVYDTVANEVIELSPCRDFQPVCHMSKPPTVMAFAFFSYNLNIFR